MKEKKKSIIILITVVLFITLWIRYETGMQISDSITVLTIIAVIVDIYCISTAIISGMKIYSVYVLYTIFYLFFIFGQVICRYFFNYIDPRLNYLSNAISDEQLKPAIILATYCLLAMNLGAMISSFIRRNTKKERTARKKRKRFQNSIFIYKNISYYYITICSL